MSGWHISSLEAALPGVDELDAAPPDRCWYILKVVIGSTVETVKNVDNGTNGSTDECQTLMCENARAAMLQQVTRQNDDSDDFVSYSCKVNKACWNFKLGDLTEEQFKTLIFVCGLKSPKDSDIRMRLITKLNDMADITLEKVVEECQNMVNLKKDTSLVEKLSASVAVHAVHQQGSSRFKRKQQKPKHEFKQQTFGSGFSNEQPKTPCWPCGGMHFSKDCQFREHQCRDCKKKGHKEGYCACFSKKSANVKKNVGATMKEVNIVSVKNISQGRKFAEVRMNHVPTRLQIVSESDITIISEQLWNQIGQPPGVQPSCRAKTASGEPLDLILEFWCDAEIGGISKRGLCRVHILRKVSGSSSNGIQALQSQFPKVFTSNLGLCIKTRVRLTLKGNPKPIFRPKRPVAYSMQNAVEDEIQRLQNLGIPVPVDHSDWAAPIVVVRKPNSTVRICADFSTGLNNALEPNQYPLPLHEDIFTKMAGCRWYSHIDLSDAYLQVEFDPRDQYLLTINTHKGLFRYTRITPGIKSAPGAFQQLVDTMIGGLAGTCGYLDDILVGGRTEEEHDNNLKQVLRRLEEYGFTVRIEKCSFRMPEVKYLGQILDGNGINPDPNKTSAIAIMLAPHDIPSLRSYLGAVNYYGKYVPEMRKLRYPMDQLLKAGVKWEWSDACQRSFDRFRDILQSPLALAHYNPKLGLIVSADASQHGIGARIAHQFPDETVKAISYATRSLTPAESNYSQIEKEGLALIFAVTRFHRMIFGRKFTLETDHKPLLAIFGSRKGIPVYTANRLQRWALTLLLFDFNIQYVKTESFGYADILSRLINTHVRPNEEYVIASIELGDCMQNIIKQFLEDFPVTFKMVQNETQSDSILKQLQQYYQRKDSLSVVSNCVLYGERSVFPSKFRIRVLRQLHKGHPGVERMRSVARNYVYWPGIDEQITLLVRSCTECAKAAKTSSKVNLESWPSPQKPWQRVHADYAGPVDDFYYLIMVDAFSKWPERNCHGMPETLVTDNGRQFVSEDFERYCEQNGILHLKTPPYHPQSNGLAERFVDTFKRTLKKITSGGEALREAIATFLLCYRSTPCRSAPQGKSPGELLLSRPLRTSLILLRPPTPFHKVADPKQNAQFNKKHGAKPMNYDFKELVWAKVHRNNTWSWEPGQVLERVGRVLYNVWLQSKQNLIRTHCNQLRRRYICEQTELTEQQQPALIPLNLLLDSCGLLPVAVDAAAPEPDPESQPSSFESQPLESPEPRTIIRNPSLISSRATPQLEPVQPRQSSRPRRKPVRYDPYYLY
ncbi:uncharacterized protein K02A2.6-like [Toxorhynchites rutilus septentrionalis]|uniref:uncharacterized protein K02A2.6-like n=1 Tax=Toxorhynchites rutilus septentrionalis TaxID=329112 RepID=UPI00247A92BF|nr:uncharacterized protein K02A2.6-like [Toxorhynchites rutilus septentrionalis]